MKRDDFPTIKELYELMRDRKPVSQRVTVNIESNMLCQGDGGVSPTTSALNVPEVALLLVSPMGCAVHGTQANRAYGKSGRMWFLRLDEKTIVGGNYKKQIDEAVNEILYTNPNIKGLILCGTCIDVLLGTDYDSFAKILSQKYGIRMTAERMDPILNDAKINGEDIMYKAIYGLLREYKGEKRYVSVNVMGRFEPSGSLAELYDILGQAGINRINYISDFDTLEECDIMTTAILNIVYGKGPVLAAKDMEKKYNIPWVQVYGSYNVEEIHENYVKIGKKLGIRLDDTKYYKEVCSKIEKIKNMCEGFRCAVGDNIDRSTVKAAVDLVGLGFDIDTIFAREITKKDIEYVKWLAENKPDIKVYFSKHPAMKLYADTPRKFDMVFGVAKQLFRKSSGVYEAPTNYRSFDYQTMKDFLDGICRAIENPQSVDDFVESIRTSGKKNISVDILIESGEKKNWNISPKEV